MWKGFSIYESIWVKTSISNKSLILCNSRTKPSWSSYKERRENDLASGAEEGRDKLRKAAVRSKYP